MIIIVLNITNHHELSSIKPILKIFSLFSILFYSTNNLILFSLHEPHREEQASNPLSLPENKKFSQQLRPPVRLSVQ